MNRRSGSTAALALALGLAACTAPSPQSRPVGLDAPVAPQLLYVSPGDFDFSENPGLLLRITDSPYGYFRFVNIPFAREVCRRFADEIDDLPPVNLHGDAHLEQYAITSQGYGLTDFDDAIVGPAVIDLVRFSTSILLASDLRGWSEDSPRLLRSFFEGYESALQDPEARLPVPDFVQETAAAFSGDRRPFLDWIETILEPVDESEGVALSRSFDEYARRMHERNPRLPESFFERKAVGRIGLGVGSALDRKYLFRVEGPTAGVDDDFVLEIKEVRDLSPIPCVQGSAGRGAFRILLGYSRIGRVPLDLIAPLPSPRGGGLDGVEFWVHAWQAHYEEVAVDDPDFQWEDCLQVVRAAGAQLGRGHVAEIENPARAQLRQTQLALVRDLRERIVEVSHDLHRATQEAWERFREESVISRLE